jgi:hypothetical protein
MQFRAFNLQQLFGMTAQFGCGTQLIVFVCSHYDLAGMPDFFKDRRNKRAEEDNPVLRA